MGNRTAWCLLSAGIIPALALVGILGAPAAGASTTPTMTVTTTTATCVDTAQRGCTDPLATIPANAQLQVICSRGGDYYVEDLANRAYEGYVPQSHVRSAPGGLGDCDTTAHPAIFAAANGLGLYGSTKYDYLCLTYVIAMWQEAGTTLPDPPLGINGTAIQWWQAYENNTGKLKGTGYAWDTNSSNVRFATPPRGALVFWWGSNEYPQYDSEDGHVAISLGNGWVVSTLAGKVAGVHIATVASITAAAKDGNSGPGSGTEAGWVMPIKGYEIQS